MDSVEERWNVFDSKLGSTNDELKHHSTILQFILQKLDYLESLTRTSSYTPAYVSVSAKTTPSSISTASPASANSANSATGIESYSRLSIPSCGTSSTMETTPTSTPNFKALFPGSEMKAIGIPRMLKRDAGTNTDFVHIATAAPIKHIPAEKNKTAAQRSPPSLTSPVGAFVLTPHPKKGFGAGASTAVDSESVSPAQGLPKQSSEVVRPIKVAAGKLPQKIGVGTKKIGAAPVSVRSETDVNVKPPGQESLTTPTQPVIYRKRILDTFDLKRRNEEKQKHHNAAKVVAAPADDRPSPPVRAPSSAAAAVLIADTMPAPAPAPADQVRSPTNANQRLRLRAAAGVRPAPALPKNVRTREIDSAARIAAAAATASAADTPAPPTPVVPPSAPAASVTVSPTTITGSPPSAPVPAAMLVSARAVQVRKVSQAAAAPTGMVGFGSNKSTVRRSSMPATLSSPVPASARVVMGGGKGRQPAPAHAPTADQAAAASSGVPAQEEAMTAAAEEPPTIISTDVAPGSVSEAMLLGLQSPTMGARRRQSYPAAESITKAAQPATSAGSSGGLVNGKGWTQEQKRMASLITRKSSATSPASPANPSAFPTGDAARSPLELNLPPTPSPPFGSNWPTVTSCPNSAFTTNPASPAEPFTPTTPMHSAVMHTTPRALYVGAPGSADTPMTPQHASTEEMRAYGSMDQLLATVEKPAAPQHDEEGTVGVAYPHAPPSTPAGIPAHTARVTFADTVGRTIGSPRPGARSGLRRFGEGGAGEGASADSGSSASPITQSPASPASRSPYSPYLGPSAGASPPRDMWIDTTSSAVQDCGASTMYLSTSLDLTPRSKRMLTSASTPASTGGAPQSVGSASSASTVDAAAATGGARARYRDTPRPKTKPKPRASGGAVAYKGSGEASLQEGGSLDSGDSGSGGEAHAAHTPAMTGAVEASCDSDDSLTDCITDPLLDTVLGLRRARDRDRDSSSDDDAQEDRGEFVQDMELLQHDDTSTSSASPRNKKGERARLTRPAANQPLSPSMMPAERPTGGLTLSPREQDLQQLGAVAEQQELIVQLEGQEQAGMGAEDLFIAEAEDRAEQADDEAASADSGISDFELLVYCGMSSEGPDGLAEERLLYANDSAVPGQQVPPPTTCVSPKHAHIYNTSSGGEHSPVPGAPPSTPATPSALHDPLHKHTHPHSHANAHAHVHRHTNRGMTKTTKGAEPTAESDVVLHHTGRGRKLRYASFTAARSSLSPVHSPTHSAYSAAESTSASVDADQAADTTASVDSESTWGLLHQVDDSAANNANEGTAEAGADGAGAAEDAVAVATGVGEASDQSDETAVTTERDRTEDIIW